MSGPAQRAYDAARYRRIAPIVKARSRRCYAERTAELQERHRAYYATHRDEVRAQQRAYYIANRPRALAQRRAYYERVRAVAIQRALEWNRSHPEKRLEIARRRSAQKRGALVLTLTRFEWEAIKEAFGHRCAYCGERPQRLTQDHLIPLSKGGQHTADNVVPACAPCNCRKGAKLL